MIEVNYAYSTADHYIVLYNQALYQVPKDAVEMHLRRYYVAASYLIPENIVIMFQETEK